MNKQMVCEMLNEVFMNRTLTGVEWERQHHEVHGEVFLPCLVVDCVWKVVIGVACTNESLRCAIEACLEQKCIGKRIEGVKAATLEDGTDRASLFIAGEDCLFPMSDVDGVGAPIVPQCSNLFRAVGLAAPYEIVELTWGCASEDEEEAKEEEVDDYDDDGEGGEPLHEDQ